MTRLSITAVKGLRMTHPSVVEVAAHGVVGDHDFCVVDASCSVLSAPRTGALFALQADYERATGLLTLQTGTNRWSSRIVLGRTIDVDFYGARVLRGRIVMGPWSELLSSFAGQPVRLVKTPPGAALDVHPVTLLGTSSLQELERQSGQREIDSRRFRMTVEFSGAAPHAEDRWNGRTVAVGRAHLEVCGTVPRCAATTRHPEEGSRDLPTVRMVKAYRGVQATGFGQGVPFGVYARVSNPGVIAVGDKLAVTDSD